MSIDVIALIKNERELLLAEIIRPYVFSWPRREEGIAFRFEEGSMLVLFKGKIVGGIDEDERIELNHFHNVERAIRSSLVPWKITDLKTRTSNHRK